MELLGIAFVEWVGYLAMAVLLVSFTMKDVRHLRIINSIGAVLFIVYGFMLDIAWPIVITNTAIICINFYYLFLKKQ